MNSTISASDYTPNTEYIMNRNAHKQSQCFMSKLKDSSFYKTSIYNLNAHYVCLCKCSQIAFHAKQLPAECWHARLPWTYINKYPYINATVMVNTIKLSHEFYSLYVTPNGTAWKETYGLKCQISSRNQHFYLQINIHSKFGGILYSPYENFRNDGMDNFARKSFHNVFNYIFYPKTEKMYDLHSAVIALKLSQNVIFISPIIVQYKNMFRRHHLFYKYTAFKHQTYQKKTLRVQLLTK